MSGNRMRFTLLFVVFALMLGKTEAITATELRTACFANLFNCAQCASNANLCSSVVTTCGDSVTLASACQGTLNTCVNDGQGGNSVACNTALDTLAATLTAANPATAAVSALLCFSTNTTVHTLQQGTINMQQLAKAYKNGLKLNIKSWDRERRMAVYSPIRLWLHANPNLLAPFLRIRTAAKRQLSITHNHVIYRSMDCNIQNSESIFAGKLKVGDCVFVLDPENGFENLGKVDKIVDISTVEERGIYAPLTKEGSIIVDGIAASCYANNENEKLNKTIYEFLLVIVGWLRVLLPSEWLFRFFGLGSDCQIPTDLSPALVGLNYLQHFLGDFACKLLS